MLVTVVACSSAVGQALPPMVIFDAKNLNHVWKRNEVSGSKYGLSDKGWINTDLFEECLIEHFIEYVVPGRPLLLLLDGNSTHYQPAVVRFAKEHGVIIYVNVCPHTRRMSLNYWTVVCLAHLRQSGQKFVTNSSRKILGR